LFTFQAVCLSIFESNTFSGVYFSSPFGELCSYDPNVSGLVAGVGAACGDVRAVNCVDVAADLIGQFRGAVAHLQ
jgi:hypothetical protein